MPFVFSKRVSARGTASWENQQHKKETMKYTVMIDLNNSWHKVAYYLVKSLATARLQKLVAQGFRAIVVPDAGYNLLERSNS